MIIYCKPSPKINYMISMVGIWFDTSRTRHSGMFYAGVIKIENRYCDVIAEYRLLRQTLQHFYYIFFSSSPVGPTGFSSISYHLTCFLAIFICNQRTTDSLVVKEYENLLRGHASSPYFWLLLISSLVNSCLAAPTVVYSTQTFFFQVLNLLLYIPRRPCHFRRSS